MDEKKAESAMQIILYAGNARSKCKKALDAIAITDFEEAKNSLERAKVEITQAHRIQTDAIQSECSGEVGEYSVLFAHAQDTLMTVNSEIIIAKQMISIFENYERRIAALENK